MKLVFQPGDEYYEIPPTPGISVLSATKQGMRDFGSIWLGESPLPTWVRIWLAFLVLGGIVLPFVYLPHPFAIANAVATVIMRTFNMNELTRVRGINKNMGWPHLMGWIPVLCVNYLSLAAPSSDADEPLLGPVLTMESAEGFYEQSRVFAIWFNTVVITISCIFDAKDTVDYYYFKKQAIVRSRTTMEELTKRK